ncbi:MAG: hypothetical protein QXX33_05310 [Candidatus Hadarchaeales archaeon]
MTVEFRREIEKATFRSPLEGFNLVTQEVEVRVDPLTGRKSRLNIQRARRPKHVKCSPEYEQIIESSRKGCFFCPENIENTTPKFPSPLPDRIWVGEACVLPNLFPFAAHHAVAVISREHHIEMSSFSPVLLRDCMKASLEYFRRIFELDNSAKIWNISWNYMPPAAASLIHPHFQLVACREPTFFLHTMLQKSREFEERAGKNYWSELIEVEQKLNERYIGRKGNVHWIAAFSPIGNKEIIAVFEGSSSLSDLNDQQISDFCEGLSAILRGYCEIGVRSFNMGTFSAPVGENWSNCYWLNIRLVARPTPASLYAGDIGFMELFQLEPVIDTMPEDLASFLKNYLR